MRILKNTKGTSIVSVMVAFLILLIGIGMLYTSVSVSQNMVSTAVERLDKNDRDMWSLYSSSGYMDNVDSQDPSYPSIGLYVKTDGGFSGSPSFNIKGSVRQDSGTGYCYFR